MRYETHVLSLVFAGALIGIGSLILIKDLTTGIILIGTGFLMYLYGYRIKR